MVKMRFKFRSEPCSSLLPLHKWPKMFSGSLRCLEPHATWHSEATGTTQEAICSDTFLEPAGQVTSTLELSVGLAPLRWMLSQKHQLHWNPWSLRRGGTPTRDLTWDNSEEVDLGRRASGESCGWHFQTKVNLKVISAPPTASVTRLCPFPHECFSLLWPAVCMAYGQDSTLSCQRWDWKRVF